MKIALFILAAILGVVSGGLAAEGETGVGAPYGLLGSLAGILSGAVFTAACFLP